MICTIFRPKRYRMERPIRRGFTVAVIGLKERQDHEIPLHTSDKRVAQQRWRRSLRHSQLESAGMLPPEALRTAAQSPLAQHLKEYVADLSALNRDAKYIYDLKNRDTETD